MTEIEKDNEIFDEKIEIDQSRCCFCKVELTANNKSGYRLFFERDNKPGIGCLCLRCREVFERLNKIKNSIMSDSEIELEVRKNLYKEGWTNEMLKAREESEFVTIN